MKKIMSLVTLVFLLFACTATSNKTIVYTDISSFPVDMSVYEGMKSTNHHFVGISPEEFIKVFREKGSGAFYMGADSCSYCQETVKYMEKAAENMDVTIYYIDVYNNQYPLMEHYEEIYEILLPILLDGSNGEKTIQTPHLFTLVNGEFATSCVGGMKETDEDTVSGFEKILEPIKK